jgi:hypothetical protein
MNNRNPMLDAGAIPADMKILESLINDMHGQKRNYVSQKIKHYQELLKRYIINKVSDNDVVLMQSLTELNSDLTMTAEDQWIGQPLGLLIPDILNCLDMEFLPEIMSKVSFTSDGKHLPEQHPRSQPRGLCCDSRKRRP